MFHLQAYSLAAAFLLVLEWPHEQNFERLERFLLIHVLEEADHQPVLTVWEDIHWADDSSLDLLDYLVSAVPNTRLLMICLEAGLHRT